MITNDTKTVVVFSRDLLLMKRVLNMLKDMGHRTILTANGKEAFSALKEKGDLLILDLADMNAASLIENTRGEVPAQGIPVLAIGDACDPSSLEPLEVIDFIGREALHPEAFAYKVNRALFSLEKPVNSRKRVPVSITAVFTVNGQSGTGILMNLGEGGAFLHTDRVLPIGSHIELTFYLDNELILARGVVRWSSNGTKGNIFCGSGIMFRSLPWDSTLRLLQFVNSRFAEVCPAAQAV